MLSNPYKVESGLRGLYSHSDEKTLTSSIQVCTDDARDELTTSSVTLKLVTISFTVYC